MLNLFICGSLPHLQEDEHHEQPMSNNTSPSSTPRRSKRNSSFCKSHNNNKDKNPYSNIGLDKFSALLSDLDEKRQKIYSETGDQDKTFVRFVYNNSNDVVPIVVKLKDKIKDDKNPKILSMDQKQITNSEDHSLDKFPIETSVNTKEVKQQQSSESDKIKNKSNNNKKNNLSWSYYMKFNRWRRPSYYLPVVIILILLFLALFGRSAAILCTSIGWYIVPTLKDISNKKRSNKKKYLDHHESKKFTENKIVIDKDHNSPRKNVQYRKNL